MAALEKEPSSAHVLTALAFTCHLDGDLPQAATFYHRALAQEPGDRFCQEMLHSCIHGMVSIMD
jgi:hypothetical protein